VKRLIAAIALLILSLVLSLSEAEARDLTKANTIGQFVVLQGAVACRSFDDFKAMVENPPGADAIYNRISRGLPGVENCENPKGLGRVEKLSERIGRYQIRSACVRIMLEDAQSKCVWTYSNLKSVRDQSHPGGWLEDELGPDAK
jgi:hypothetical protein